MAEIPDTLEDLYSAYLEQPNRKPDVSLSIESTRVILREEFGYKKGRFDWTHVPPRNVLDLGSGWTTHALRWAAVQSGRSVHVLTTDTEEIWLSRTLKDLELLGLVGRIDGATFSHLRHTDFAHNWRPRLSGEFDLIVYDLGKASRRAVELTPTLPLLAEGGRIYIDDWHFDHYRLPAIAVLEEAGFVYEPIEESRDKWGRVMAYAERGAA